VIFHGNSDKSINLGKQNTENAFAADTNYRSKYYTNTHTDEIKQPQKVKHLNKPNPPHPKKRGPSCGGANGIFIAATFSSSCS